MRAYVDSDVFIWFLRGERKALDFLLELRDKESIELWTGALQRAEIVFSMRPGEEHDTLLFLSQFRIEAVDQEVVDVAGGLCRTWNPGHGTEVNDAMLAATVMKTGGTLYTLNIKHYPMPHVEVCRAWR